jgi:hypothetical protein
MPLCVEIHGELLIGLGQQKTNYFEADRRVSLLAVSRRGWHINRSLLIKWC